MFRRLLTNKAFWAMALPLALCGAAFAGGGGDCPHAQKADAAHAGHDGHGKGAHHCNLNKNVSKTAKMLDDGAVVTLEGKTDEAVTHIRKHLGAHEKGESGCPDCPLEMEGVTSTVKLTDKGGEVTLHASNPEALKVVQKWASAPGSCCARDKSST